jgi:hypothetical protein
MNRRDAIKTLLGLIPALLLIRKPKKQPSPLRIKTNPLDMKSITTTGKWSG